VLINLESSIGAFLLTTLCLIYLVIIFTFHLFTALPEYNHKCTQPCYFPLLLKHVAQKEKMGWNSSTRSSMLRGAPVIVPVMLWSLLLFCFIESRLSL
jgi:hypothetical protein